MVLWQVGTSIYPARTLFCCHRSEYELFYPQIKLKAYHSKKYLTKINDSNSRDDLGCPPSGKAQLISSVEVLWWRQRVSSPKQHESKIICIAVILHRDADILGILLLIYSVTAGVIENVLGLEKKWFRGHH